MAREILVRDNLTDDMISFGEALLNKLDKNDAQVSSTFWLYDPEERVWRLFFASELVESEGPRKYYKKVLDALNDINDKELTLSLSDISVTDNSDKILQALTNVCDKREYISKERISREAINGHFIEDAFVYRINL